VVSVAYASGRSVRWPIRGDFDSIHHRVTVGIPEGLLEHATGVTLALAIDSGEFKAEPPGPRYWDGKNWETSGTIKTGKRIVVLIHGIFSSVETAFPKGFFSSCPQTIADRQGFDQVLGFDYDWFEPPAAEGKLFADFLKKIVAAQVSSMTVEAHSYGSLVTLAAIPGAAAGTTLANVVTMGGPLPLRGTPLAEKKNYWRLSMMFGLLDWYFDEPPSYVDRAFDSGMVAALATNSDALKQISSDVKAMPNKPHFIQAAGTNWICFVPGVRGCTYGEETFKKILVDGTGVQLPWDGVVETIAAESTDIPAAVATPFPLSHIELQCDSDVIKWIGKQLK
jgi:pimeloyl-ACP methyl ester carboxylesterase